MVATAGGLAARGLLPIVHASASMLASRANEPIHLNACDGVRVVYALSHAGLTPAGSGPTRQSLRDVSLLGATPGVLVIQPSCERSVEAALRFAVTACTESVALRLQSGPAPLIEPPADHTLEPGRGVSLTEGRDALLFAYGPVMLAEALAAASRLEERGIGVRVVDMPWLNHVDIGWLAEIAVSCPSVYVIEDHAPIGGLGDMLREAITTLHAAGHTPAKAVQTLGVEGLPAWGTRAEVLAAHGLDAPSLERRILAAVHD
jgi:transketolase